MKTTGNELSRSSIVKTAQDNPLPVLMIGLGAGLLVYNNMSKRNKNDRSMSRYRSAQFRDRQYRPGRGARFVVDDEDGGRTELAQSRTACRMPPGPRMTACRTPPARHMTPCRVRPAAPFPERAILQTADTKKSAISESKAQETYTHYLEEKPWAIGAVVLAAGAAIGLADPIKPLPRPTDGRSTPQPFNKGDRHRVGNG